MKIGMLWLLPKTQKTFRDKIVEAGEHYFRKHGKYPNTCFLNPKDMSQAGGTANISIGTGSTVIDLRPLRSILPNHLWIGIEDEK